jgi:hypothetical protein
MSRHVTLAANGIVAVDERVIGRKRASAEAQRDMRDTTL